MFEGVSNKKIEGLRRGGSAQKQRHSFVDTSAGRQS
jgi:hypothetical protein